MADPNPIQPAHSGSVTPPAKPARARKPAATPEAPPPAALSTHSTRPANVTITQGGADRVDADSVSITQGGVTTVTARSIDVRQGGIANAQAEDIAVSMGGVALARADRVSVEMGGVGLALAGDVRVTQSYARSILARESHIDQGLVGALITGRATLQRPSGVFLLVAGRVEGPVKAVLDWRGALAFGAAFGLVLGLLRRR